MPCHMVVEGGAAAPSGEALARTEKRPPVRTQEQCQERPPVRTQEQCQEQPEERPQ